MISWKKYPVKKNTWKPSFAVHHLNRLPSTFYKNHLDKAIANFSHIDIASFMAKSIVRPNKPILKLKHSCWGKKVNKQAKKSQISFNSNISFLLHPYTSLFSLLTIAVSNLLTQRLFFIFIVNNSSVFFFSFPIGWGDFLLTDPSIFLSYFLLGLKDFLLTSFTIFDFLL